MVVIIKKGENVNYAGFNDAKKNLLDNGCHHQKMGRMWMYEYRFLMMPKYNKKRLFQDTFKVKQTKIASRLNQDQENKDLEES